MVAYLRQACDYVIRPQPPFQLDQWNNKRHIKEQKNKNQYRKKAHLNLQNTNRKKTKTQVQSIMPTTTTVSCL